MIILNLFRQTKIFIFYFFTHRLSDILSSNYAISFLFLLGNVIICLSFGSAEVNFQIKYEN